MHKVSTLFRGSTFVLVALLATTAASCSNNSPTNPTGGGVQVTTVTPGLPLQNAATQTLQINGTGFAGGLSVTVTSPSGGSLIISGGSVQNVTNTSFQMAIALTEAGTYTFVVNVPGQNPTSPFQITVVTQSGGGVSITSVTPSVTTHSTSPLVVTLSGIGFDLGSTVEVSDPQGVLSTFAGSTLTVTSSTSVEFSFAFTKQGSYLVNMINSANQISNTVTVTVN